MTVLQGRRPQVPRRDLDRDPTARHEKRFPRADATSGPARKLWAVPLCRARAASTHRAAQSLQQTWRRVASTLTSPPRGLRGSSMVARRRGDRDDDDGQRAGSPALARALPLPRRCPPPRRRQVRPPLQGTTRCSTARRRPRASRPVVGAARTPRPRMAAQGRLLRIEASSISIAEGRGGGSVISACCRARRRRERSFSARRWKTGAAA